MYIKKKIKNIFHRHPLFYYLRYVLISKNYNGKHVDTIGCFNDLNELKDIPKIFFNVNSKINLTPNADEFEKALEIATYLRTTIKGGTAISLSSSKTLEKMLEGKGGVCGDFSQIFSVFCFINNIRVKEWHCVDRFYKTKYGHTFNEIYSTGLKKWIAIDSHKSIYFIDDDETPLSVIELFTNLRNDKKLKFISFSSFILKKIERVPLVYSKNTIPFILDNYINKNADYFLDTYHQKYPSFIVNTIPIIQKKSHHFVFVMDNYKKILIRSFFNR